MVVLFLLVFSAVYSISYFDLFFYLREGVNFALAQIDLSYLAQVRENMPVRLQRRPSLYGDIRIQETLGEICIYFYAVPDPGPNFFPYGDPKNIVK